MSLVVDASVVISALTNTESEGAWSRRVLSSESPLACQQLPAEAARVLRRRTLAGEISDVAASVAHAEMLAIEIDLHPYEPYAERIWQLRHTVTISDAWYVALAEILDVPLATIDLRLTRAPGPRCRFVTPP